MSMLTLQVLALLLLFGLIGALLGWLIRPFFCKPNAKPGSSNLSGSGRVNANTKTGTPNNSVNTSVDTSHAKRGVHQSASTDREADSTQSNLTADIADNKGIGSKVAAAGIAAAGATAAAVSSSSNNDQDQAAKARKVESERIAAEQAKADQAAKQAALEADKKKLAAEAVAARDIEKAKADKMAADKATAEQAAEEKRLALEKANAEKLAEEQRIADENAQAAKIAEEQRMAAESAKAAKLAEDKRLADEKANHEAKLSAIEADKRKLAAEGQAARKLEADRLALEEAKAKQAAQEAHDKAESERVAAEKAKAEQVAKDAADKAEADRIAAEQKAQEDKAAKEAADKIEADRLAAEKAKAEQAAKEAAAKAEADKIAAEEKAKAEQVAKEAAAKAELDRISAEQAKAEQAAKDAAAQAEADKIAAMQKAKAEQAANDAQARADQASKAAAEKANAAKLAATAAAVATASSVASQPASVDDDDYTSVTDDMRPARLSTPRNGQADDLKRIKGIGPVIEGTLNEEGVYHFQQIADFTPDNVKWVDKNVAIPGRVHRDDWIGQAKALLANREYDGYAKDTAGIDDPSLPPVTDDMRPAKLAQPIAGKPDDLKRISGIGPVIERTLNQEGIYHFQQIADFTPDNVNWVDRHISFPGRITREEWIRQAKGLALGVNDGDANTASDDIVITEDMRPTRRSLSTGQKPDDLKAINGIGPVIETSLNEEGVYFYQQIADFNDDNTRWVDNHMAFPGRIHREDWIAQAKVLAGQKASSTDTTKHSGRAGDNSVAVGKASSSEVTTKPATTSEATLGSSGAVPDSMKPSLLSAPQGGKADDLKRIKGIGKVLEKSLHKMGIYHYEQLAELSPDNISWLTDYVSFPENRINDENWTGQAKALAEGKQTEYSQRFDKGDTPYK